MNNLMPSKILAVFLCCITFKAHAIVITPDQPPLPPETTQDAIPPPANKSSRTHVRKSSEKKPYNQSAKQAEKPVSLPPPSKASLGFYQASLNTNYDMMELYLQQGADINCQNCDSSHQMTALFRTLRNGYAADFQLADWLIQRGADINIPATLSGQTTGVTLVMNTAGNGDIPHLATLDYLVKRGADFKALDSNGSNALHYIQRWDVIGRRNSDDASNKIAAFVDQLVQHGIDVNRQDKSGATTLMNAANSCSPAAIKLLLAYGANTALINKLGKSALDIAIDRATRSGQGDGCNEVAKILSNPQQISKSSSIQSVVTERPTSADSGQQGVISYVGTYSGKYNGSDEGSFQVAILQNGVVTLNGHSSKIGASFTGEGKVNNDGSVVIGSASTGSTFTGSIGRDGAITGTWKNVAHNQAGSFQGGKGTQDANIQPPTSANPLQAIGSLLNGFNKILAPQR